MALSVCGSVATDRQGRELVEHGTPLFPVACYHDNISEADVPWHWHDELEALVVETGIVRVSANGTNYLIKPGEGFFVNTGVLHGGWPEGEGPCCLRSVVFHPRLVGGERGQHPLAEIPAASSLRLMPALRPFYQCPGMGESRCKVDSRGLAGLRVRGGRL